MRTMVLATACLAAAAAAPVMAQTSDDAWLQRCERNGYNDNRETYCEVRVSGFRPGRGAFHFEPGSNGGVRVEGWDRDSVSVHARIRASAESIADARSLARDAVITRDGNTVRSDVPETRRRESVNVELVVFIPRQSDVTAETTNGPLSARNLYGTLALETRNGPLELESVGGDVRARTINGPLEVRLSGRRWEGVGLNAETSNGPATLWIPEDYSAELETGTRNGPMDSDFPLTVTFRGRLMNRQLNTTLGRGGAPIRVVTSNGPLSLRRL